MGGGKEVTGLKVPKLKRRRSKLHYGLDPRHFALPSLSVSHGPVQRKTRRAEREGGRGHVHRVSESVITERDRQEYASDERWVDDP